MAIYIKILLLGNTLTDKSGMGKMKDFYVLDLFNCKNLDILFEKDLVYELLYKIPFTCLAEAAANQFLLKVAFEIYIFFF